MSYAIVVREGKDNRLPMEPGDDVITYELEGDSWPYADLPPHEGMHVELARYMDAVLQHANDPQHWRVVETLRCECYRAVGYLLAHSPSGRLWVTTKTESIPTAFQRSQSRGREGWALHGKKGQAPHVGAVASCKGCDKRWLVVSFIDRAEMLRVVDARHGAKVVP